MYRSQSLLKKINEACEDNKFICAFDLFDTSIYMRNTLKNRELFSKDIKTLHNLCFIEYNRDFDDLRLRITQVGRDFAKHLYRYN